jgi:hypothetical protein
MAPFWDYFTEISDDDEEKPKSSFWEYFTASDAPDAETVQSVNADPCAISFDEDMVYWAMRNIPVTEAVKHFLVCGAIGTGKTTTIDLFLQSIAPRFKPGRNTSEQLIIFDAKCDIIPKLASLGFSLDEDSEKTNIWLLNPYDKRGATWAIAEAVKSPLMARHFATLLVPEEKNSTAPFFWSASRQLVYAVLLALNRIAGTDWTLRDLLCALISRERISAVTEIHPRAKELASAVLSDTQHSSGVISTLATKLAPLEEVAKLWHNPPQVRSFSISKFLKRPGVLILGNDPLLRESLWPINAMLLTSLSKHILRGPEVKVPKHWFVLDEFAAMEKVASIQELVNRGRSKGASVLIGLQGIDRVNELYLETGANDLLEQLSNKTFLRAGGPKTAEWIERYFGKYRCTEPVYSESWSRSSGPSGQSNTGQSGSVQYQTVERSIFLASFFMDLPFTGPGLPLVSVSDIPSLHKTLITRRWFDAINSWRKPPDKDTDALQAREEDLDQALEPWDKVEEARFCGPGRRAAKERARKEARNAARKEARAAKKQAEKHAAKASPGRGARANPDRSSMATRADLSPSTKKPNWNGGTS